MTRLRWASIIRIINRKRIMTLYNFMMALSFVDANPGIGSVRYFEKYFFDIQYLAIMFTLAGLCVQFEKFEFFEIVPSAMYLASLIVLGMSNDLWTPTVMMLTIYLFNYKSVWDLEVYRQSNG